MSGAHPASSPHDVADAFHDALAAEDWDGLRTLLTDDARWVLPGTNHVSGPASGGDAVVERARLIARYGMRFDVQNVLVSARDVTLYQRNTAQVGDTTFTEYVATVCRLRGGQIAEIETFVSDPDGFDRFFRTSPP